MTDESIRLDGYVDVVRVDAGGLGDIYRATRVTTGGPVAIKVVREHTDRLTTDRRVRRELEALLKLKGHPNVVQVEELVEVSTGLALVMEFVGRGSLLKHLDEHGPLLPAQTIAALLDVTRALADAHALGIVHRDIKPHNVMIGDFGQCKVCDFGISAMIKDTTSTDRTSALSYRYASPEEIDEDLDVGPPTDVYSLGVTARQMLTGETNPTKSAVKFEERSATPGLAEIDRTILRHLRQLTDRMTAKEPDQRPTARGTFDILRRLEDLLGSHRVASVLEVSAAVPSGLGATESEVAPDDDATVIRPRQGAAAPPPVAAPHQTEDAPRHALPDPVSSPDRWWETR